MLNKYYLLLLSVILFFWACKKPKNKTEQLVDKQAKIVVLNEGNFNWNNASVDIYYPSSDKYTSDIYFTNNNKKIGDVLQSGKLINGKLYLVVNNSGYISVIDTSNFKEIARITGFFSPRYIAEINKNYFVVNDLYKTQLYIVSSVENKIVKTEWIKEKCLFVGSENNQVYALTETNNMYRINETGILDTILKPDQGVFLCSKKDGNIFFVSKANGILTLYEFGFPNYILKNQINITSADQFVCIKKHPTLDILYFCMQTSVLRYSNSTGLTSVINASTRNLYGMEINKEGNVILFDAKDYVSRGEMIFYDKDFNESKVIKTGLIPNGAVLMNY